MLNLYKDIQPKFIHLQAAERRQLLRIHTIMKTVYDDCSYAHTVVVEWTNEFRQGKE